MIVLGSSIPFPLVGVIVVVFLCVAVVVSAHLDFLRLFFKRANTYTSSASRRLSFQC